MPRHPEEHRWIVRLANVGRSEVPPTPDPSGPPQPPRRLEVFAMGPDWVQLTWSALGPGAMTIDLTTTGTTTTRAARTRDGDERRVVTADGGPGSVVIDRLPSGTPVDITIAGPGIDDPVVLSATTLTPPPGEELLRIATVSDVHVGSHSTGYFHTIVEIPEPAEAHPRRCLRAAMDELTAWGAEHLIIKGDLVDRSHQANWDAVGEILGDLTIPIEVVPGNHERSKTGDVDPHDALRAMGLDLVSGVHAVDHDGVRIVMADTTLPLTDWGTTAHVGDELVDAAGVDRPVLLALHHQLMRFRLPTYLPPGLPGPHARHIVAAIGAANPRVLVTSGHTHRHRRHRIGTVTATEVGSTKDFPGTWAGYQVYEGGIIQIVRRIAEPSCIRWTDRTRRAALGLWASWSPGPIDSRCFSLTW